MWICCSFSFSSSISLLSPLLPQNCFALDLRGFALAHQLRFLNLPLFSASGVHGARRHTLRNDERGSGAFYLSFGANCCKDRRCFENRIMRFRDCEAHGALRSAVRKDERSFFCAPGLLFFGANWLRGLMFFLRLGYFFCLYSGLLKLTEH